MLWATLFTLSMGGLASAHPLAKPTLATSPRGGLMGLPAAPATSPLRPGALATSSLHLVGLRLAAPTSRIDVPKDVSFSVPVGIWVGDHQATPAEALVLVPVGATLTATLTGPGISPLAISGDVASGLSLPALRTEGDFSLSDIRLVKDGATVMEAEPRTVAIHCLGDVLISSVTSSPMTMAELRDAGVQLQPGNYEGRRFTMGLTIGSQQVSLTVPVAVPIYNGLEDPRAEGSIGRLEIQGITGGAGLPDLSVVVADILPEKDPFSLTRPTISHTLRSNFKALIVIPGSIGYLHQFYKVNLVVFNALAEGSPFQITHLSTTLRLPAGGDGAVGTLDDPLRLASREGETDAANKPVRGPDANGTVGAGDTFLKAGESGMATFFVEALKEGAHQLNFDIRGQFEGGGLSEPVPLIGRAQGKVLVRNPNFSMVLVHPDVVRRGEEYTLEARLTNTSETLANGVTVTLDRARLGSVKLVEDLNQPVDTLRPGETATFKFKLRALRNGEVRSSYLYIEQGTIGFQLTTGLGERNIRLNPDTLVLPQTLEGRKGLPEPLREAMLRVLGQAYAVASTKGALPQGVLPIAMSAVTGQMSKDLSEQGLFLKMGIDRARIWMRLWEMFLLNPNAGFDQLVRTTDAGRELRNAFMDAWSWAEPDRPMPERLGEMLRWKEPFGDATVAVVEGTGPGIQVELLDDIGHRVVSPGAGSKDLPYLPQPHSAWGGNEIRQWASLTTPVPGARLRVANPGPEAQTLRVATVAPVAGTAPTSNLFEFRLDSGHSALFTLGKTPEGTVVHFAPDGTVLGAFNPAQTTELRAEPFKVLAVHRYDIELDPAATPYGTHVMMLFNRPIMALNLPSGDAGIDAAKVLAQVEANAPWRKVMAPDPDTGEVSSAPPALFRAYARVASLYLERPVGPYVPRRLTFAPTWKDAQGNFLTGDLSWPILCGDIPGGALVRGKVRKVNGGGLPAKMTYWYMAGSMAGNIDLATGEEFLEEEVLTHYALVSNFETEADGSYQLDYVPEPVSFAIGPMLLQGVTAEGTAWGQASVLGNGQLIEMDLVLEGKGSVDGYVLDAQGSPVADAQVQFIQEQPSNPLTRGTGGGTFSKSTKTDADGHFRMDGLKTGVFSIRALKGMFGAAASNEIARDGDIVHQNVILRAATGTLRARLLDVSGQVVLSQNIRLGIASGLLRSDSSASTLVWPEQAKPEEGSDGWVTFSNVPAGDVGLMVPSLPLGTVTEWRGFLDPGTSQDITLRMLPPAEQAFAHFLVLDSAGKPVPGVYLFEGPGPNGTAFAISNEDGTAPKRPVPSGSSFHVYAYHPGWTGRTPSESVVIQPGEDRLVHITMPPRGALRGTVKYPDGTPVKGAYVAIPPVYDDMKKNRLAITGSNGAYVLPNVQVGTPFRLAAVGPELRTAIEPMTLLVADGQDLALDLTLPFVGKNQVGGVIYQPREGDQKIPTMAQIWVDGLLPIITPSGEGNIHWGLFQRETTGAASTGVEGKFLFTGLPQGTFTLHANSDFFPVEVKSGGDFGTKVDDVQVRDIYLSNSFAGELKGVVYKRDGQTPVAPDVRVRLIGGSIGELIIHTTEGGKYRFPKVIPEGCYKLRVEDPASGDIAVTPVKLEKETSQAKNLRLWGRGALTVKVQDSFGRILPEGVVTLSHSKAINLGCPLMPALDPDDLPPLVQKLKPDMEGVLVFDDLLEGPISVSLKNPTGLQGMASVTMPEGGGDAEVVVRLQPVGDVLGSLFRADGTAVPAGRVDAYQNGRWLGVSPTRMDGVDGRFRFQVLPTGAITLEAWDPDSRQTGKGVVEVVAGGTSEITITTHDKGPVMVSVAQEGLAVAGAAVRLTYRGGDALDFSTEATSDADGKATFYLPPGDYTASATDPLSLATGSVRFTREVNQGEIQVSITLQAVRSLWATTVPPPGAPAGFSMEGWSLREKDLGRRIQLDTNGQGLIRDLPVGSHTLALTDLRGRQRGTFTATLTLEGGAVQVPPAPFQAAAYGNVDVRVVDAHGQPVPNVDVYAGGAAGIRTDATGLAKFLDIRAGNISVWAAGASGAVLLQQEGETVQTQLQLPPTASVHGTVFDSVGQPAPFLLVSAGPRQTATDAQGQFRVTGLGLGTYTVTALFPTGRRAATQAVLSQADQDVEVRLDFPPQGSLSGAVVDPLRSAPPPVHVMVYLASGGNPLGETFTSDLGIFHLANLPAGQALRVVGILDDGRTEAFNQTFTLPSQEGAALNLDFTLPALVHLKGWTLDPLGNKIPMTVLLLDDLGRTLDRAVTTGDIFDPDHPTFFFRYLRAGHRYRLIGQQEMTTLAIAYLDVIPVGDKEVEEVQLRAQTRREVRLQARYPDGTPTPGPGRFVVTSQSILGGRWEGPLGADGSALLSGLPEGLATVTLTGLPNQPTLNAAFTIPAQSAIYDVVVPAIGWGSLSVKVQTTSGRVLTGGGLTAQGASTPRWMGQPQADGSYRFDAVWIGVPLTLQATGFGLVGAAPAVTLSQHGQSQTATYPAPDQASFGGVVRDSRGLPVAGAVVSTSGRTTTTNASGAYLFSNLPLGHYSLLVTVPGRAERAVASVALGADGEAQVVDVPLKGTGAARVKVSRPDGSPVAGQAVSLRNASAYSDGRVLSATTDGQGVASFSDVLEGDIRAWAMVGGVERAAQGTLAAGGTLSLEIQTKDISLIGGQVRRASTAVWPAGSFVRILGLTIPLQADGALAGPAPSVDYTAASVPVQVVVGGMRDLNLGYVQLVKNGTTVLDFTAPAFGAMSGVVKDARGAVVSGAQVSTAGTMATTDAQGAFRIDGLFPGSYRLLATLPNRVERGFVDGSIALDGDVRIDTISLKGTGTVRVTTLAAEGTPLPGQTVKLENQSEWSDHAPITKVTDAQGVAVFLDVLEGSITASATLEDLAYHQTENLGLDGTLNLTLKVRDFTTFSGRIQRAKAGNEWPAGTKATLANRSYDLSPDGTLVLPTPNPQVDFGSGTTHVYVTVPSGIQFALGSVAFVRNGETVLDLTAPGYGGLSGTVRMPDGTPVAGAVVSTAGRTATTDAAGAYRFPELLLGSYGLVVTLPNRVERAVTSVVLGVDGEALVLDVPLKGAGAVQVHVGRPDGSHVAGQIVSLRNASAYSDGRVWTATTDVQGMASFGDVLEGDILANAVIGGVNRVAEGTLAAGGTLSLEIQTKDISLIGGQVRRASATVWPAGSFVRILGLSIPLQADGTLMGPAPSVDYTTSQVMVQVSVAGQRDFNLGYVQLVKNGTTVLDVTAPAFGSMTGVVKDARGSVVAGAHVNIGGTTVATDGQGAFRVDGLQLGSYQLVATVPNRAERCVAEGSIALDGEERSYTLSLKGTGTVRVTALAATGTPMPGQTVELRNSSPWSDQTALTGQTDAQGQIVFNGVLEGFITAKARLEGTYYYQSGTLSLDGTLNLALKVRDFTTFSGRVRRAKAENAWPEGTRVSLAGQSYGLNPDGTLVLPDPNPQVDFGYGTATAWVSVPGGIQLSVASVTLVKNGETVLDLTAPGFGSLSGTVKLQNGSPAANVSVTLDGAVNLTTDASGTWRRPMDTVGIHRVVARTSTSVASGELTLAEDGGTAALDLTLVPNTVSLPVYMSFGRVPGQGWIGSNGGCQFSHDYYWGGTRPFISVDGAAEAAPAPQGGIGIWLEPGRQLAFTAMLGKLEVTQILTMAGDSVVARGELRIRNTDAASHRVKVRHDVYLGTLRGVPSGAAQPVMAGDARDVGVVSSYGTVLWGNRALAPVSVSYNGLVWPEVTLAAAETQTLALGHAPYALGSDLRPEGAARVADRLVHGAAEWVYGSDPAAWANWQAPMAPAAEALAPWDATLNLTLKDALGARVKNAIRGAFLPMELLAPRVTLATGTAYAKQPRDGGQISLSIPGNPSLAITRDLPETGTIDVLAVEGGSVRAQVKDAHGTPVAGASVAFPVTPWNDSTDTSGNTGLWLLAPGTYELQATLPNSDGTVTAKGSVALAAGQTQTVEIAFPAVGGLQVTLLSPNGQPYVGGGYAYVQLPSGGQRSAYTNNGTWTWANLLPGTYALRIPDPRTGGTLATDPVQVQADAITRTTLRLPGLGQVQVAVLDPLGNRVPRNQYVTITGADGGARGAYTDDSGTVAFANLAPGVATLRVTHPTTSFSATAPVTVLDGQVVSASIQLPGSGSLRITVTTADGRPVVNRYLYIQQVGSTVTWKSGYTDAAGQLTLGPIQTGVDHLLVDGYGSSGDPFNPKMASVPFRLTQEGEVQTKAMTRPVGSLRVLVRDAVTGAALSNAQVTYRGYTTFYTDASGVALFKDVALDTSFSVSASLNGYLSAQNDAVLVPVSQPLGTLTLDLSKPLQIGIKVIRANGSDAPTFNPGSYRYWYLRLTSPEAGVNRQTTSYAPAYTWTDLSAGQFTAEAYAYVGTGPDGTVQTASGPTWMWKAQGQAALQPSDPQPILTLRLPALAAWTLHLKGEDGAPLALDRMLRLVLKSSSVPGYLVPDRAFNPAQQGADLVMAEHFPEGTHTFSLVDPFMGELTTVDLTVGTEHDGLRVDQNLTVPTPPTASLSLRLRDSLGRPIQQEHGFRLTVKTTTRSGYAPEIPLSGTEAGDVLQIPEGAHTFAIGDREFGEVNTFELTVAPGDVGNTLERTIDLPYVHATWKVEAVAGDGRTPAVGAYLGLTAENSGFWLDLEPGVPVFLEVPSVCPLKSYAYFEPLGSGNGGGGEGWRSTEGLASNPVPVELYGEPRDLAEGEVVDETLQLPLTVARFRLLDQDGQTPMPDLAAHLILPDWDARNLPMPLWTDAQGVDRLLLLGQPEGSTQDVIVFDSGSGLGKALQIEIPPLGQALDQDQVMPPYAWVQAKLLLDGQMEDSFEVGVPAAAPGVVAPWAARWDSQGEGQVGPIRVPVGVNGIWGWSWNRWGEGSVSPQKVELTDLQPNETRVVEILGSSRLVGFDLRFYEGVDTPIHSLGEGWGEYTISTNGALPFEWWWDESGWFNDSDAGYHDLPTGAPYTITARISNYDGRPMEGVVTGVAAPSEGNSIDLILSLVVTPAPPPVGTAQPKPSSLAAQGDAKETKEEPAEVVYAIPMVGSDRKLQLHLKEGKAKGKGPAPPRKLARP